MGWARGLVNLGRTAAVVAFACTPVDAGFWIAEPLFPLFCVCLCRAPSASGAQPGKRKLLAVSSSFRLPGDAVPAHMMFAANKAPRLGGEAKPTASGLSSQL